MMSIFAAIARSFAASRGTSPHTGPCVIPDSINFVCAYTVAVPASALVSSDVFSATASAPPLAANATIRIFRGAAPTSWYEDG
jgi:hypothetical protein